MRLAAVLLLLPSTLSVSCTASLDPGTQDASQPGLCEGVTCGDGFECLDGACVPVDPCADVVCDGPNERCSGGRCVSCESDQDGDGFEACVDCDDADRDVVPGSERPCETSCGLGTVRCLGLAGWSSCSAPLECVCQSGQTRTEACGRCGTLVRPCGLDGTWDDPGPCEEAGECVPGTIGTEDCADECAERERECTAACAWGDWGQCQTQGDCTAGETETSACPEGGQRSRTCGDDCAWGAWTECGAGECVPGAEETEDCEACGTRTRTCDADGFWGPWGACAGQGVCTPGATENQDCGDCGAQSRTCGDDCTWSVWGACGGEGACSPGETRDGGCDRCSHQECTNACAWGDCELRPGSVCEWEEGTNWRCCGGGGHWQFCLPNTCDWSDQCAVCDGCC